MTDRKGKEADDKNPLASADDISGEEVAEEPEVVEEDIEEEVHQAVGAAGELAAENAELLDRLRRLQADFENYRKRMLKEQTRIVETAEADLVKKLLAVIDNLERALANPVPADARGLYDGVKMVLDQFTDILTREGLEVIDPDGELFDPEHHEAFMVVETDDCPEDTVVEVSQKGYRFRGILLRPAMVKVSCPVK